MKILVVEDDVNFRKLLEEFLVFKKYDVHTAETGKEAVKRLKEENYEVVLLDILLPDIDGLEVLKLVKEINPLTEVIVITGHGTVRTAVDAMKLCAFDFLTKPCSLEEIYVAINKAKESRRLKRENELLKREKLIKEKYEEFIFESPAMKEIIKKIKLISCADCPVLITGETGTGKEVIAKLIHKSSNRSNKPMVSINIAAIPRELLEAELFGYEQGAFTGASKSKEGFFELAHKGTIFLDEIGEIDLDIQAKLLRVIETKKFFRVGGRREVYSDVRIITATNKNLRQLVKEGKFREDLYYRLNVVEINIPPLRERKEDIIPLAEHFLKLFSTKYSKSIKGFTEKAKEVLIAYPWPGNVRELKNVIERLVLFSDKEIIDKEDLYCITSINQREDLKPIEVIEKEHILRTLQEVNFNKKRAAQLLGIPLRTFYRKLKKYGIE